MSIIAIWSLYCDTILHNRLPNILEYLRDPLQSGLGDRSAYVRKTAVMGIVKLFYVVPSFITGTITVTNFIIGTNEVFVIAKGYLSLLTVNA